MSCAYRPKLSSLEVDAIRHIFNVIEHIGRGETKQSEMSFAAFALQAQSGFDKIFRCVESNHKVIHDQLATIEELDMELNDMHNRCKSLETIIAEMTKEESGD